MTIADIRLQGLSHNDIKTIILKTKTTRVCQWCDKNIVWKYQTEIVKATGEEISTICIWGHYYYCSEDCKRRHYEWVNEQGEYYGLCERDGQGKQIYKNIKDPFKERRKKYARKSVNSDSSQE